jgi:hypothetical protein
MKYFYTCLLLLLSLGVFAQVEDDDEVDESTRKEMTVDDNYAKYLIDGIKNDAVISIGVNLSYLLAGFPAAEISVKIPKTPIHITGGGGVRVMEGYMQHNGATFMNQGVLTGEFQSGSGYFVGVMYSDVTFCFTSGGAIGLKFRSINSQYIIASDFPLGKFDNQITRHFYAMPMEYRRILGKNVFTSIGYEYGAVRLVSNNAYEKTLSVLLGEPIKPNKQYAFYQNFTLSFGYLIK